MTPYIIIGLALLLTPYNAMANEAILTYSTDFPTTDLFPKKKQRQHTYMDKIYYMSPLHIKNNLSKLFPNVLFSINTESRTLLTKTTTSNYKKIKHIIKKLDQPLPQIDIEVTIIEVNYLHFDEYKNIFSELSDGFKINYDFNTNKLTPSRKIEGTLVNLSRDGDATILAKPTLSTIDNHTATIHVGDRIPYVSETNQTSHTTTSVQFINTGIELEIHPKTATNNMVITDISAKISSVKLWKKMGTQQYPILSTRKTATRLSMELDKTIIIAGLFDKSIKRNKGSPGFFWPDSNNKIPIYIYTRRYNGIGHYLYDHTIIKKQSSRVGGGQSSRALFSPYKRNQIKKYLLIYFTYTKSKIKSKVFLLLFLIKKAPPLLYGMIIYNSYISK